MCGRYTLTADPAQLLELFGVSLNGQPPPPPRYNIAPTQPVTAVRERNVARERELTLFHWGLIPSWAKDPAIGSRMINARAETVAEKVSFRSAFKRQRCLIPSSGFYEWQRTREGKQPLFIHRADGAPFAMAGLWEQWHGPNGEEIASCTLITCAANDFMRPLHARMPVILQAEDYASWLRREEVRPKDLLPLLEPYPWQGMTFRAVSTYVNNPAHEGEACIQPPANAPGE